MDRKYRYVVDKRDKMSSDSVPYVFVVVVAAYNESENI